MNTKALVIGGAAVAGAYLLTRSKDEDDLSGMLGGGRAWGGAASKVITTEDTPTAPQSPIINIPAITPYVTPAPSQDWISDPVIPTSAPKKTPTPTPTYDTVSPVGARVGFGGGGAGGRGDIPAGGGFDLIGALTGAVMGFAGQSLFGPVVGTMATAAVAAGIPSAGAPPAVGGTPPPVRLAGTKATAVIAPTGGKKESAITTTVTQDKSGRFTGSISSPDYSKSVVKGGATYTPYEITSHTGKTTTQISRTGTGGKTWGMSKKSASILSGSSPAAKAWRKRYGDA